MNHGTSQITKQHNTKEKKGDELVLSEIISDLNKKGISVGHIYVINGKIKLIEINYKIFVIFVYFSSSHKVLSSSQSSTKTLSLSHFTPSKHKNVINPKETLSINVLDFSKKLRTIVNGVSFLVFTPLYTITSKNQKIKCYKNGYIPPDKDHKDQEKSINIYPLISYSDLTNNLNENDWEKIKSFHNSLFTNFLNDYHKIDIKPINSRVDELKKCLSILHILENKPIKDKNDLILLHSTRKRLITTTSKTIFILDQLSYYLTFYNFFNSTIS